MPEYLLRVTPEGAAQLKAWLGGQLRIVPAWYDTLSAGVPIAGLDALGRERHQTCTGVPAWDTKVYCTCGHQTASHAEMWKHQADALRAAVAVREHRVGQREERYRCHACGRILAADAVNSHLERHGLVIQDLGEKGTDLSC